MTYARLFMELNRQIGVLENALVAGKDLAARNPQSKSTINRIVGACVKSAPKGWERVHAILQVMWPQPSVYRRT